MRRSRVSGSNNWRKRLADDRAAQLVEFAVALPLLVVFVVGIYDFSGAFTLKQRLTNTARDGARAAAGDPSGDVLPAALPPPQSVIHAFQIVYSYLVANNLNVCGMTATLAPAVSGLTWTYSSTGNGCPSPGLTILINRGYYFPSTGANLPTATCTPQAPGPQTAMVGTCVSIQYPYPWRFGKVASLLGSNNALPQTINAIAVSLNEN